jgi:adenine deaminase
MSFSNWRTRPEDAAPSLIDVAIGRTPADLVLRDCRLVNVNTREIEGHIDVAIRKDRVALVGDASHTVGPKTTIIDVKGRFVTPGLIDSHMHIESSMVTPTQFARAVLPLGTTAVFVDPHEMGNVMGLDGIKYMIKESLALPLKVFFTIPSCVPALPGFETAGASIGPEDVKRVLKWPNVVALGEMMNFPGVLNGDRAVMEEIKATLGRGMPIEGHSPGLAGKELSAYVAAGITSCHESTTKEEALEKLRRGMYLQAREGSAWLDVKENVRAVTETEVDPRHMLLVTDDREPWSLIRQGHMNHVVRRAIEEGVDPLVAYQMATINAAEHYEMGRYIGSVAPMRSADLLIMTSLDCAKPDVVIADGRIVAEGGRLTVDIEQKSPPERALNSIHLEHQPIREDFVVKAKNDGGRATVRAIKVMGGSVLTEEAVEEVPVKDGDVKASTEDDVLKAALIERHHASGRMTVAFTKGFGFQSGAVASTVAHDSHNLLVVGVDETDMAYAALELTENGGGMVAVKNKQVLGMIRLPVAGLLSERPVEEVAAEAEVLLEAWRRLGCDMVEPFMTMSLMTLTVLPELRLSDRGLLDTKRFRFVEPLLN